MASELELPYSTAGLATLYAVLRGGANFVKASDGSLIAATTANWPAAAIALSDGANAYDYVASIPAGTPAGLYTYAVYLKLGGAYAGSDTLLGVAASALNWNGTSLVAPGSSGSSGGSSSDSSGPGVSKAAVYLEAVTGRARVFAGSAAELLARITDASGVPLTPAGITSIVCKVIDAENPTTIVTLGGGAVTTFATLQLDGRWTADSTGFNLLIAVPGTAWPTASRYQVEATITPVTGNPFKAVWIIQAMPTYT